MRNRISLFCLLFFASLLAGAQPALTTDQVTMLRRLVDQNRTFSEGVTGFNLVDLDSGAHLYGYNHDQYFVPASNVKLLTAYLAARQLGDRTPGIFYQSFSDRIEIWGAGYPLLLHPEFGPYDELAPWIQGQSLPIVLNLNETEAPPRYGAGWSWDDYNYGSVYERSDLPIYGNRLYLDLSPPDASGQRHLYGSPPSIADNLVQDETQRQRIFRLEGENWFSVNENFFSPRNFPLERSISVSPEFTFYQLRKAFPERTFGLGSRRRPPTESLQKLEVSLPDTLYRKLLQQSDNYLAEQLVLQAAADRYGKFDEDAIFDYATDTLFAQLLLGELKYTDGSGLSRYNLIKPRQLAQIVRALDYTMGHERLLGLLPAGGVNGTLKNRFSGGNRTYVWAKTGSLSGVICLSGLVQTRSGKWMAFSFLHNNVMASTSAYYREMERVMGWIHENL